MGQLSVKRRTVSIDAIEPNPWNYRGMSPAMFEKEKISIETHGYIRPILVRTLPTGNVQIIDGEHRWKVTKELGYKKIDVDDVGVIDDRRAKKLTIILNETHGDVRYDDLSKLVAELDAEGGHEDLLSELPFPDAELKALIALLDAPSYEAQAEPSMDAIDDGEDRPSAPPREADDWETLTLRAPVGIKAKIDDAVRRATRDVKNVPRDVRVGIALERIVDEFLARASVEERTGKARPRRPPAVEPS